jgi:iron(III) transport system substrate-binding protein
VKSLAATSYYYGRLLDENPLPGQNIFGRTKIVQATAINVSGAGVITGSDNAAGALALIEWLSSDEAHGFMRL